jgi:hypothetical protein
MFRLLLYGHLQAELKKCYIKLAMLYRVRDLVLHIIIIIIIIHNKY